MGLLFFFKQSQNSDSPSQKKKMKALLVIALATVASAKPWGYYTGVPYTQAHIQGLDYTHALGLAHPVAYTAPVAAQTCKNEAGALVTCAIPAGFVGNSVYAYNHAPAILPAVVAAAAPAAEEPAAVEEAIVDVKKREAEAGPEAGAHYYGYPWYGYRAYGCRNVYGALVPCAGR